jgi:diphosphomevalonate decarboxylase
MSHISWESPSNIAIVKYWGKHGRQLPNNPSLSLTLNHAKTTTSIRYTPTSRKDVVDFTFLFEGKENPSFSAKIGKFINQLAVEFFPFLLEYSLVIESSNTFPHSSGIASSASSMSALALCLVDMQKSIGLPLGEDFKIKASTIARLGSGSACRSVFSEAGLWGYHAQIADSSDGYAIGVSDKLHEVFKTFHDDILIISADEKSVSSTAGHNLMVGNPYAEARYAQAGERLIALLRIMETGDVNAFGKLAEDEAMTLHALMMCSDPSYILMKTGTLKAIEMVRKYRQDTGLHLYFTLDAGPNVHLLYPHEEADRIHSFINTDLKSLCADGRIIHDQVGQGPLKLY